jgi:hypothetical protein
VKGKAIETRLKQSQPHFTRTRLKSTVRLKSAASTALQPHFCKGICQLSNTLCVASLLIN